MKKILVTGGTVFVSRCLAEYFVGKGNQVYVLNRNTRPQPANTILIQADRHNLGKQLKGFKFDAVIDVNAYTGMDVASLCDALGDFGEYILISSSAVYPESNKQPFTEEQDVGANKFSGKYGTDKIDAEQELRKRVPEAYVIRPPYLYGPQNNVYREGFVFDCAMAKRNFYLPKDGEMKLQFFHVEDLCRFVDVILEKRPEEKVFNVGNTCSISVREWVQMCYEIVGSECNLIPVHEAVEVREYFCFHDYEYFLDVSRQRELMPDLKPFKEGLIESYQWYKENQESVRKKPYIKFIEANFQ